MFSQCTKHTLLWRVSIRKVGFCTFSTFDIAFSNFLVYKSVFKGGGFRKRVLYTY